jgi:hypothetical protein
MAMEAQVDRYAWFDRKIGAHLDHWIKIKRLVAAPAGLAAQTGGGGLAGSSLAKLEIELPVAKCYGNKMKMKLRRNATHRGA